MNSLQLYRQGVATVAVPIDEQTQFFDECMGRFDIQCQFFSPDVLDIRVDDYIIYNGVRFTINVPYQIIRDAVIQYNITFEHPSYWLKDIIFTHKSDVEFSIFATPKMLIKLIVDCMNVEDSGWMVGSCEAVEEKLVHFFTDDQGYTCKGALQKIAEDFSLEFWFSGDGKTINITKQAGQVTTISFAYGRTKGIYSVERGILETPLYNRIYGFGSTKNIPEGYRNNAKRLIFDGGKIERPLAEGERRRETSLVLDDIFPERTGTITAISADLLSLTDTTLDFDVKSNFIDGEQPKVVFKSGEVGGQEFEIVNYNNAIKTFKIKVNTEKDGTVFPNALFSPKVGDKYTLVGIAQPQSYLDDAENRLYEATEKAFKTFSRPPYRVVIDEKYMRENAFVIKSGDRVRLKDDKFSIDDMIRVTSVSFPLVNPNQCTVVISDNITYTQEVQNIINKDKVKEAIKVVDRTKAEQARRQAIRFRQMQNMIFNPETGYFDETIIRPNSIETLMLAVGAKSSNFYLSGITIDPNNGDNPNKIVISSGQLIHKEIEIEGLGFIWEVESYVNDQLETNKAYYMSIKANTTSLSAVWYISETPMKAESEQGYYHFNVGVLYNVLDGRRDYSFTNGMTTINGDTITSGKINADRIDVDELFARSITATNMNVTGNSRIGPFSIIEQGLYIGSNSSGGINQDVVTIQRNGLYISYGNGIGLENSSIDMYSISNVLARLHNSGGQHKNIAHQYDMGDANTAIDVESGQIRIGGDIGITEKIEITLGGQIKFMRFKKGVFMGITDA